MNYGDIRDRLTEIINELHSINKHTDNNACCVAGTSSGVNVSVPAGFGSVAIALTSGSINVTLSDGSIYPMTVVGEVFVDSAPVGSGLPAYTISGSGTWKWHAIN